MPDFQKDKLLWHLKGQEYGDWTSGPTADSTFIFSTQLDATQVS